MIPKSKFDTKFTSNQHNVYFEKKIANAINESPDYIQDIISRIEVKGQNVTLSFRGKELRENIYKNGLKVQRIGLLRFRAEKNKAFKITVIGVPEVVTDNELLC